MIRKKYDTMKVVMHAALMRTPSHPQMCSCRQEKRNGDIDKKRVRLRREKKRNI